jgi:hypothetical protein
MMEQRLGLSSRPETDCGKMREWSRLVQESACEFTAVFFSALKVVADGWRPCHKAGPGVQAKTNHPL